MRHTTFRSSGTTVRNIARVPRNDGRGDGFFRAALAGHPVVVQRKNGRVVAVYRVELARNTRVVPVQEARVPLRLSA